MNYTKDICKLVALLVLVIGLSYGIYLIAKKQAPANQKKYRHPVHQVGGQW